MVSALGSAALRYATRGYPVFPCQARAKRPRTPNGCLDASTDQQQVERWWRADGNANIGIATGQRAGLVVLDVDGDEGAESLRALERLNGGLPRTASVVTPNGGAHYYFKHPDCEVGNSVRRLGAGLDVRASGGYVIAPPSIGANGRRYEPDERAPMALMPDWLLSRLRIPQDGRKRTETSEWLAIVRDGLGEGERNHGIARIAGHLLHRDIDARLVLEIAHLVNGRFRPPLSAGEVDAVVESIAGRELRKRGRR